MTALAYLLIAVTGTISLVLVIRQATLLRKAHLEQARIRKALRRHLERQ